MSDLQGNNKNTGRISRRRQELQNLPKEKLIELLMRAEGEDDDTMVINKPSVIRTFDLDLPWEATEFLRLPEDCSDSEVTYQVKFISFDLAHKAVSVEICGDVIVGRNSQGQDADLDFSAFGGGKYGVSRRHAIMRPAESGLELIDLGSTNGTRLNGAIMQPHEPQLLQAKDVISFGGLQIQLHIR